MLKLKSGIKFRYKFSHNLTLLHLNNCLFLISNTGMFLKLKCPNYYFLKKTNNNLSFIFPDKYRFISFFKRFVFLYNSLFVKIYFFKIKLRGTGYRIKRITKKLLRIFFGKKQLYYVYIPEDIFFKFIKRRMIFYSDDLSLLNTFFYYLLRLKKMDFYTRKKIFITPKRMLFIKKKK